MSDVKCNDDANQCCFELELSAQNPSVVPHGAMSDRLRWAASTIISLQREVESFRGELARWKEGCYYNAESSAAALRKQDEQRLDLKHAHAALKKAKEALEWATPCQGTGPRVTCIDDALAAIKECGL